MLSISQKTARKWNVILGCVIVSILLTGCLATKPKIEAIKEVTHWIGDKKSCIEYLNSPWAQSERYVIEALK